MFASLCELISRLSCATCTIFDLDFLHLRELHKFSVFGGFYPIFFHFYPVFSIFRDFSQLLPESSCNLAADVLY